LEELEKDIKDKQELVQHEQSQVVQNRQKFLSILEQENERLEKKRKTLAQENTNLEIETEKIVKKRSEIRAERSILDLENDKLDELRASVKAKRLIIVQKDKEFKEKKTTLTNFYDRFSIRNFEIRTP